MPTSTKDVDVVRNRLNVDLAENQRLFALWLPRREAGDELDAKSDDPVVKDEDVFTPVAEALNPRAETPKNILGGAKQLTPNEVLRTKLLGKKAARKVAGDLKLNHSKRSNPHRDMVRDESDVDPGGDEEGRSALGRGKRRKGDLGDQGTESGTVHSSMAAKNLSKSYLDEVLSGRSKKFKKYNGSKGSA